MLQKQSHLLSGMENTAAPLLGDVLTTPLPLTLQKPVWDRRATPQESVQAGMEQDSGRPEQGAGGPQTEVMQGPCATRHTVEISLVCSCDGEEGPAREGDARHSQPECPALLHACQILTKVTCS